MRLFIVFAVLLSIALGNKVKHENRIINGWVADAVRYKFYALIYINQNPHCGGTIIKENIVLTAASTVYDVNPSYLKVYPGMTKLEDAQSITPSTVSNVVIHPNFQNRQADYDLAVVYLSNSLTFNDRVGKIVLSAVQYPINYVVTICGFGLADCNQRQYDPATNAYKCTGQASQYMRVAYMNIKQYTGNTLVTNATYKGIVNCYGDFGGPVVYDNVLVGVQSLVQNADCSGDSYDVSVPALLPWIKQKANL